MFRSYLHIQWVKRPTLWTCKIWFWCEQHLYTGPGSNHLCSSESKTYSIYLFISIFAIGAKLLKKISNCLELNDILVLFNKCIHWTSFIAVILWERTHTQTRTCNTKKMMYMYMCTREKKKNMCSFCSHRYLPIWGTPLLQTLCCPAQEGRFVVPFFRVYTLGIGEINILIDNTWIQFLALPGC